MPPKINQPHHVYHKPTQPKPPVSPKRAETVPKPVINANNLLAEKNLFAARQKFLLKNNFNWSQKENQSVLIGGTGGSTAAQFSLGETQGRNSQTILVKTNAATPSDFVGNVERDLQKLAPGTKIERAPTDPKALAEWNSKYGADTAGIVKLPETRSGANSQGNRLLDQLTGNKNQVTINYEANNAYAMPRSFDGIGSVTTPGRGTGVDVFYDPNLKAALPSVDPQGNLVNANADSAIILGHELSHASHMQRGTQQNAVLEAPNKLDEIFGTQGKENVFAADGKFYREGDNLQIGLREEYRTVGTNGQRYGSEPNENSLRTELGIPEKRVSYQENGFYQYRDTYGNPIKINNSPGVNGYNEISPLEARIGQVSTRTQTFGDNVLDGVKGSRNSALIGAGFNTAVALYEGKDAKEVATDAAIGAGTGVTQEVIERTINGARSTTTGMTASSFQAARATLKGAAIAGAVINTGFAVYNQFGNLKNDATRSQAVGVIAGEAVVGAASGAAGAYAGAMAGAAIGSIVPGVGTVIGGIVGFAAGAAVGYLADKGLRGIGVNKLVAQGATAAYDGVSKAVDTVAVAGKHLIGGAIHTLSSIFG